MHRFTVCFLSSLLLSYGTLVGEGIAIISLLVISICSSVIVHTLHLKKRTSKLPHLGFCSNFFQNRERAAHPLNMTLEEGLRAMLLLCNFFVRQSLFKTRDTINFLNRTSVHLKPRLRTAGDNNSFDQLLDCSTA